MFVVLQIPLLDARVFLDEKTRRLEKPRWIKPTVGKDFLRRVGGFKLRRRGGSGDWFGEDYYCSSSRWLRFFEGEDGEAGYSLVDFGNGCRLFRTPIFRRWLSGGNGVVRLEVGWRVTVAESNVPLRANEVGEMVKAFCATDVRVRVARKVWERVPLTRLSGQALRIYNSATTDQNIGNDTSEEWWVQLGKPLIYVDYSTFEITSLPKFSHKLVEPADGDLDVAVAMMATEHDGCEIRALFASRSQDSVISRHVRVNLLRIYAEIEAFELLLASSNDGHLVEENGLNLEKLQRHLKDSTAVFTAPENQGRRSAAFEIAMRSFDKLTGYRTVHYFERLRSHFDEHDDAKKFLAGFKGGKATFIIDMSKNKINVEKNTAPVAIAVGRDNVNAVAKSKSRTTSPEFLAAKAQLEKAVTTTLAAMRPEDDRKIDLEQKLETLKATGKDPKWYEVSAKGLKEAAEAVGDIAKPVAKAALEVLKVLTGTG